MSGRPPGGAPAVAATCTCEAACTAPGSAEALGKGEEPLPGAGSGAVFATTTAASFGESTPSQS
jgi:hypothetical protein